MKLYTKTGDDGTTGLFGGTRVPKNNPRVTAYGDVDELNAAIGYAIAIGDDEDAGRMLQRIQSDLFSLGAELASAQGTEPKTTVGSDDIKQLEDWIDAAVAELTPLKNFILPGGTPSAAVLHLVRTVSRRAERSTVALSRQEPVDARIIAYLNRLSDLLFALARRANHRAGVADIPWRPPPLDSK